jgi:putative two-component system response regulator
MPQPRQIHVVGSELRETVTVPVAAGDPSGATAGRPLRLLIVDRSADDADRLLSHLQNGGCAATYRRVDSAAAMRAALGSQSWDLVVAEGGTPPFDVLGALAVLGDSKSDVPLIVVSAAIGEEHAVQAMRAGASDYLSKGKLARLIPIVERVLKDTEQRRARQHAERAMREREQQALLELAAAYEATVEGWSNALDLRDRETEGHSRRVTELTVRLARQMGMSDAECVHVRRGALLHDIGKMGVPDGILHKPAALTADEWVIMRRHPTFAHELLAPIEYLRPALDIPYCHHEKWDGTGYPRGLKGEEIPLPARIFAAVDIWDALRSDRPYRPAWSARRTHDHIASLAGSHLDPRVVAAFLELLATLDDVIEVRAGAAHIEADRPGGRILVVDDYDANVKLLKRWLSGDGYEVLTASSGRDALAAVAQHRPDLLLLDIMIPEPDGVTVCRMLKANPATAAIPIIFMSGLEPGVSESDARRLADDYIAKPIDVYELRSRVRQTLQMARSR